MTPFEIELLKAVWPAIWTAIMASGAWFLRTQNNRLDSIAKALHEFGIELARIEKQMLEDRSENRHRVDRLIGESDARIGRIEAVCETHHGAAPGRRSGDYRPINWAHDSDVSGDAGK
jgi:isopentenyldiphosphate isomerase